MKPSRLPAFCTCLVLAALLLPLPTASAQTTSISGDLLDGFRFRSIGPAVTGGRIHDVEALPNDPSTIYVATASGGVWKSTNKGTTWTPIFERQPVSTFGDLAIAPTNPDVIWAGTGEQNNRQSTSWGNGVYRSADGGTTWTHVGLEHTRHISRVLVHPRNPDVAYVAALGNLWAPSPDRGVYKTTDGGRTWQMQFYVDSITGVVDLVMDPSDPNTLYAASYQRLRRTWGFNGGGPGSGIHKTTDGGRTWQELTNGLPAGDKGRIGLAIAATNSMILNATVQHTSESGTYRTEDGGRTWEKVNRLNPRPMYYSHIFIDPTNADRVYVLATTFSKSEDGGRTFETLPTRPTYDVGVHSDFHTMWIDPDNPEHFYLAGDGGLHETWDMGSTYIKINNMPIAQFYAIGVDMREPYFIFGGMQDNHSWMGPSATRHWAGIINDDWRQVGFGDGMYQQIDPTSHRYAYILAQNGSFFRLDAETGDALGIRPTPPPGEQPYRFDWVTPSLVSRHDPAVVYLGGNRLFISRDRGGSWERTVDLTRQIDRDTLHLMGVRGADSMLSKNDGTSSYGEIVTIAESPLDPNVLWVGTDDGNLQVSQDGGATWTEVAHSVHGVPRGTYVSRVMASGSGPEIAYATFDAHRDGDFAPYVYRTDDLGQSWTALAGNLPEGSLNVIVEHPDNPRLLFLGSEHSLYASTDAGAHWAEFPNLPTTLYDDLVIHPQDNSLVVGTHGRSIWILDDVTPLVEWSSADTRATAHLFSIRPATIFQYWKDTSYRGQAAYAGENPPFGALLTYYLPHDAGTAAVRVMNARGDTVRVFDVPAGRGLHRVTWDLRHPPPPASGGPSQAGSQSDVPLPQPVAPRGAFVSPGTYSVALHAAGTRSTQSVVVRGDPLMPIAQAEWEEREAFLVQLQAFQGEIADLLQSASELRSALASADSGDDAAADSVQALERRLRQIRGRAGSLATEFNGRGVRQGSLYPPTGTHRERRRALEQDMGAIREALQAMTAGQ